MTHSPAAALPGNQAINLCRKSTDRYAAGSNRCFGRTCDGIHDPNRSRLLLKALENRLSLLVTQHIWMFVKQLSRCHGGPVFADDFGDSLYPIRGDLVDHSDQHAGTLTRWADLLEFERAQKVLSGHFHHLIADNHIAIRPRVGMYGTLLELSGKIKEILDRFELEVRSHLPDNCRALIMDVEFQDGSASVAVTTAVSQRDKESPFATLIHGRVQVRRQFLCCREKLRS